MTDIGNLLRLARCGHVQFDPANQAVARHRLDLHDLDYRYFLDEYTSLAPTTPLDVERLARAIAAEEQDYMERIGWGVAMTPQEKAARIAAAYAAAGEGEQP